MKTLASYDGKQWEYTVPLATYTLTGTHWPAAGRALALAQPELVDFRTGEILARLHVERGDIVARYSSAGHMPAAPATQRKQAERITRVWQRTLSQFAMFARALERLNHETH